MHRESAYHEPVLAREVTALLGDAQHVLDGTLGGGGHSAALLERGVRVTAVDRDADAIAAASARLRDFVQRGQLRIVQANFAEAGDRPEIAAERYDGILLDLGVSSHQLDDERRGFTFRRGAPLDMRMGSDASMTAAHYLNQADPDDLTRVFREYGDEPRARRLAGEIVRRRGTRPFETSDDLVGAIRAALGPRSGPADFARIFQAVRIEINHELSGLESALPVLRDLLSPGGTLAVISYHSGEDRLVKRTFQAWSRECVCPPRQPVCTCDHRALGRLRTRKAVVAMPDESEANPRARSARLRAWQSAA